MDSQLLVMGGCLVPVLFCFILCLVALPITSSAATSGGILFPTILLFVRDIITLLCCNLMSMSDIS